jgi:hypothetical protein
MLVFVAELEISVDDERPHVGEVLDLVGGAQPGRDEWQRRDEQ